MLYADLNHSEQVIFSCHPINIQLILLPATWQMLCSGLHKHYFISYLNYKTKSMDVVKM